MSSLLQRFGLLCPLQKFKNGIFQTRKKINSNGASYQKQQQQLGNPLTNSNSNSAKYVNSNSDFNTNDQLWNLYMKINLLFSCSLGRLDSLCAAGKGGSKLPCMINRIDVAGMICAQNQCTKYLPSSARTLLQLLCDAQSGSPPIDAKKEGVLFTTNPSNCKKSTFQL